MAHSEKIVDLANRYFTQQAELYGDEFYVGVDVEAQWKNTDSNSLAELGKEISDCRMCALSGARSMVVFGVGDPQANLMCIGEAPGHDEDKQGQPFVGAAGQLLNKILAAIGFERAEVYIANIVKCRPPGNRDPQPEEITECLPYLRKQIDFIRPKVILALGRVAAQTLLATDLPLSRLREDFHRLDGGDIEVVVTYHPAALLRNEQLKRQTWEDVKKLRARYDEIVGDKPTMNLKKS
ncbi:MAG: uracil-DNA glycosylase family protein [bacterium]